MEAARRCDIANEAARQCDTVVMQAPGIVSARARNGGEMTAGPAHPRCVTKETARAAAAVIAAALIASTGAAARARAVGDGP